MQISSVRTPFIGQSAASKPPALQQSVQHRIQQESLPSEQVTLTGGTATPPQTNIEAAAGQRQGQAPASTLAADSTPGATPKTPAAGNFHTSSTGGVLAVLEEPTTSAASESGGFETDFRSFGKSAPGIDIYSIVPGGSYVEFSGTSLALDNQKSGTAFELYGTSMPNLDILSTVPTGPYRTYSGTSMANGRLDFT